MSQINTELLKKVRDKIASTPEAYDQHVYGRSSDAAPCGTAACIAGWACILADKIPQADIRKANPQTWAKDRSVGELFAKITDSARSILNLTDAEADTLFTSEPEGQHSEYGDGYDGGWPEPFRSQWDDNEIPRHLVAVAYLDHIIATRRVVD